MEWFDFVRKTSERPGMWVGRPYIDGLTTLWLGFSHGAQDPHFETFRRWVATDKYPAEGDHRNPLSLNGILRGAVGGYGQALTDEQDNRAVALLIDLVDEFKAAK